LNKAVCPYQTHATKNQAADNITGDKNMLWDNTNTSGVEDISMNANAESCLAMGMKYCIGHGVAQNNIIAHKWFNIASIKGSEKAKSYRLELSQEMTASEIAEAQRQARQFLTLH
jgi:hypothetical protein